MNGEIYDEITIERISRERFGLDIDVDKVIADGISTSRTAEATVFLTSKKHLYVFISARSRLLLGDVSKMISRMGLRAELFLPPVGNPDYFNEIGREKFREVFPGRGHISEEDIRFYKTLAPYNPALVQISEVKNGEIYQYDSDSKGSWRLAVRFAYRRIKTS